MNSKILFQRTLATLCVIMFCAVAFAQMTIKGTVKDATGDPVIGANVLEKGTNNGTITDFEGNYTLTNVKANATLVFSYIGYVSQEIKVNGQTTINATIQEDSKNLEEVVVIGYGAVKKKDLTGSVASVSTSDLAKVAGANALSAMQAKVPGVDLTQSDGQAGSGVSITVRGNRSITASNSPLIIVDGVEYGSTLDIPASDIESMDILKDASSTAIYGTKGANGVIIITTKRGKAGKTRVNVNAYWSFNSPTSIVKSMYGDKEVQRWVDRANYRSDVASGNWGSANTSVADIFGEQSIDDGTKIVDIISQGSYADWYDEIFQNSTTQNYEVSVSGGNNNTNFNISLAAMYDKGLLKNDALDRYNGRVNIDHSINKIFKVGASLAFTYRDKDARNGAVFNSARKMTSLTHVYGKDGEINETPNIFYVAHVNPLMDEGDNYKRNIESTRFLGSGYLQANIIKNLVFKTQLSVDRNNSRTGTYQDFKSVGRYQAPATTAISNATSVSTTLTWQNTLNYNFTLDEKHDLGFLLGHEMSQTVGEGLNLSGTSGKEHYYNSSYYDVTKILVNGDLAYSSSYEKKALLSYFARANYSYLSKYLFQATLRADGSSVLADGHKWGCFPSVSAGWRINEESFMQSTASWLSNLKLRLSWGVSGNAAVDPYQTMATVEATVPGSATQFIPMTMSNPDLSWETTKAWNVGFDYGFLDSRITGTIDYYITKTDDLLYYKSAPTSSVFSSVLSNVGQSKGHGIEISLNALAVKSKDFQWDINASYSHSHDEVAKLADGLQKNVVSGTSYLMVGQPISMYYDYEVGSCWNVGEYDAYVKDMEAKGITVEAPINGYGAPGTIKIIDQNNDGKITADDDRIVYNRSPKHVIGLTNTFSYKNFALSIQAMARLGGYMAYDKNNALGLDDGDANWADVDYWTPANTGAKIPSPGACDGSSKDIYTKYKTALLYEKADFFKIKDITLSYTLDKSLLEKAKISNAKVYCSLKNFITLNRLDDGYDPERGGSINFPLAKQFVLGVNLSF
jgi:TonB-linked SusC/RagA family outer membrane protein